jgi:hypothetical protein
LEEWGHSSSIEQETVRSIVEAYGEGKITLPAPQGRNDQMRYAPHFSAKADLGSCSCSSPYTLATLAEFLGWKEYKVEAALGALALIDDKIATEANFAGLTTKQAHAVTQQAKRALKATGDKALAKAVATRLSTGMRKSMGKTAADGTERKMQDVTTTSAKRITDELMGEKYKKVKPPKSKKLPPIGRFAEGLAQTFGRIVPAHSEKLKQIIEFRNEESFSRDSKSMLVKAIARVTVGCATDAGSYDSVKPTRTERGDEHHHHLPHVQPREGCAAAGRVRGVACGYGLADRQGCRLAVQEGF